MSVLALLLAVAGPQVRVSVEPASVEVGEPFHLQVEGVAHAATDPGLEPALLAEGWVLLGIERLPGGRLALELASLEPGTRAVPAGPVLAALELAPTLVDGPEVEVRGVLGAEEDAPRPLRGLPDDFAVLDAEGQGRFAMLSTIGGLLALLGGALLLLARRLRSREHSAPAPDPLALLEDIERGVGQEAAARREATFRLSRLVREATDLRLESERPGLTDEEWLATLEREARLGANELAALRDVLEACAEAKYAGSVPTSWAVEQALGRARPLVESAAVTGRRSA